VVPRHEMSKRESCRRGGGGSHHGFGGWQRGDGEEQSAVVMKLGVSAPGARRGESGGRHRRGEDLGCYWCPFIGVEAGRWAVQEELDGQRRWVLMTFSTPVTGLKIKGNEREGDRMEQRLDYSSGGG
jgi:hypothetical protein